MSDAFLTKDHGPYITDFKVSRWALSEHRHCYNIGCGHPADRTIRVSSGEALAQLMTCQVHERQAIESSFSRVGQSVRLL